MMGAVSMPKPALARTRPSPPPLHGGGERLVWRQELAGFQRSVGEMVGMCAPWLTQTFRNLLRVYKGLTCQSNLHHKVALTSNMNKRFGQRFHTQRPFTLWTGQWTAEDTVFAAISSFRTKRKISFHVWSLPLSGPLNVTNRLKWISKDKTSFGSKRM